jgi:hypothetical protein
MKLEVFLLGGPKMKTKESRMLTAEEISAGAD